jgi:MFS family permease
MALAGSPGPHRGWYHGWNIVAVSVLVQVVGMGLTVNAFSLFLQDWSEDLHTPISTLQLALLGLAVTSAIGSPIFGTLADKFSARWMFFWGVVGIVVFHLAMGMVTAPWQLIAIYSVLIPLSLGGGGMIVANAVVSRWFVRRAGLALGLTAFGMGMAGIVLPPIIAGLPNVGWRTIWQAGGVITAVLVIPLVLLVIRDRPTERDGLDYVNVATAAHAPAGAAAGSSPALSWLGVLKRRNFWLLLAVYLPILATYGGVAQNMAPIAASQGFGKQAASYMLAALGAAHVVGNLSFGMLSDRFGNRWPLFGLALAAAAGALAAGLGHSFMMLGAGAAFVGLGAGIYTLLAAAIAAEFGAADFGRAYGLALFFMPVTSLGPILTAKVQEMTGSYAPPLIGFAIASVVGGVLALFMRERRLGKPTEQELGAAMVESASAPGT